MTNELTKQKQTHRHRKRTCGYKRGNGVVSLGVSGQQTQAIMYSVAKQKVPSVWHRGLYYIERKP